MCIVSVGVSVCAVSVVCVVFDFESVCVSVCPLCVCDAMLVSFWGGMCIVCVDASLQYVGCGARHIYCSLYARILQCNYSRAP